MLCADKAPRSKPELESNQVRVPRQSCSEQPNTNSTLCLFYDIVRSQQASRTLPFGNEPGAIARGAAGLSSSRHLILRPAAKHDSRLRRSTHRACRFAWKNQSIMTDKFALFLSFALVKLS